MKDISENLTLIYTKCICVIGIYFVLNCGDHFMSGAADLKVENGDSVQLTKNTSGSAFSIAETEYSLPTQPDLKF